MLPVEVPEPVDPAEPVPEPVVPAEPAEPVDPALPVPLSPGSVPVAPVGTHRTPAVAPVELEVEPVEPAAPVSAPVRTSAPALVPSVPVPAVALPLAPPAWSALATPPVELPLVVPEAPPLEMPPSVDGDPVVSVTMPGGQAAAGDGIVIDEPVLPVVPAPAAPLPAEPAPVAEGSCAAVDGELVVPAPAAPPADPLPTCAAASHGAAAIAHIHVALRMVNLPVG